MNTRKTTLEKLQPYFPQGSDDIASLDESTRLSEMGLTSLHLITLVMTIQQELGVEVDQLVDTGMPITLGDLLDLVEQAAKVS